MSTQQTHQEQHQDATTASAYYDLEMACADAMLDQVDTAQQQVLDIRRDIALLKTMENALDLISENMAKIKGLVRQTQQDALSHSSINQISDEILSLLMVNMLIAEDTEFNGHLLFRNNVITMHSFADGELTLTTTVIPEINGTETGDFQAISDDLSNAARIINRQYQRIGAVMRTLLRTYNQLQGEVNLLLSAQTRLSN